MPDDTSARMIVHERQRDARRLERIQEAERARAEAAAARRPFMQPGRRFTQRRSLRERVGRRAA
jgi:hypothetical protein